MIICVGRLTRQKKFLDVIHAIKNLEKEFINKINLVILGEGEQKELIIKEIKENNIKNVFLLGYKKSLQIYF